MEFEVFTEADVVKPGLATAIHMTWVLYTLNSLKQAQTIELFFEEIKNNETKLKGNMLFIKIEGARLSYLVPEDILRSFLERIEKCWEKYSNILKDYKSYLPEEIDNATDSVIACICRELQRFYKLNKSIPAGILKEYWDKYSCSKDIIE